MAYTNVIKTMKWNDVASYDQHVQNPEDEPKSYSTYQGKECRWKIDAKCDRGDEQTIRRAPSQQRVDGARLLWQKFSR